MWHRDIKWTNAFVKNGTSRFVQSMVATNIWYINTQYQWSTIKKSIIKWGILLISNTGNTVEFKTIG